MPVTVQDPVNTSIANGLATVFPYQFLIPTSADIAVELDGVVTTTGFTVSGAGVSGGGNITFAVAPANGVEVLRYRNLPAERSRFDWAEGGDLLAQTHDANDDYVVMLVQQLLSRLNRSVMAPRGEAFNGELPAPADRASGVLGFDALGALAIYDPVSGVTLAENVTYLQNALSRSSTVAATLQLQIFVPLLSSSGSGTQADPWIITSIVWERGKHYFFPRGWYRTTAALNWRKGGAVFRGQSSRDTVIEHTGNDNIINLDGGDTNVVGLDGSNIRIESLRLKGNVVGGGTPTSGSQHAIYVRNTHHSTIRDVRANDFMGDGIHALFSIHWLVEDFVVSPNEGVASYNSPANGVRMPGSSTWGFAGNWTFINPVLGACRQYGFDMGEFNTANNVIICGACESNVVGQIIMRGYAQNNKFFGMYHNGSITDGGSVNHWYGLTGGGGLYLNGAWASVYGGLHANIDVGVTAEGTLLDGCVYDYGGGGAYLISDLGKRTIRKNCRQYTLTGRTLIDGPVDFFRYGLTGSAATKTVTIAFPTAGVAADGTHYIEIDAVLTVDTGNGQSHAKWIVAGDLGVVANYTVSEVLRVNAAGASSGSSTIGPITKGAGTLSFPLTNAHGGRNGIYSVNMRVHSYNREHPTLVIA